jgi:hypothetical protein
VALAKAEGDLPEAIKRCNEYLKVFQGDTSAVRAGRTRTELCKPCVCTLRGGALVVRRGWLGVVTFLYMCSSL